MPSSSTSTPAPSPATPLPADLGGLSKPSNGATSPPPFLTRDMLAKRPLRTVDVTLPDGSARLKFRAIRQAERERLDDEALDKQYDAEGNVTVKLNNRGFQTKAAAMTQINEDGSAYYDSVEQGMELLGAMDDADFAVIWDAVDKLNILTAATRAALGKASEPTPSANSSSTSPTSGAASSRS